METWAVKFRFVGSGPPFRFVTPNGGWSRLKLYAARYESREAAEQAAREMTELNVGREFKPVRLAPSPMLRAHLARNST